MRALLDINVLIALLDENHAHREAAVNWFTTNIESGWASCPLTQNGCVRIISQSKYPNPLTVPEAVFRMRKAVSTTHHLFVADSISLLDKELVNSQVLLSPKQLTDTYLLALAVKHRARFVTFDRSIHSVSVIGATDSNLVII